MYSQSIISLCACGCGLDANDPKRPQFHLHHTMGKSAAHMTCVTCGRAYSVFASLVANGKMKACSRECASQARKGTLTICGCCGVPIHRCKNAPKEPWNKGTGRVNSPVIEWPNRQIVEFWSLVQVSGEDDCHPWNGPRRDQGYGIYACAHKNFASHRVAYELANGPITDDMDVCHSCDNPPCCNPRHLWLGVADVDNQADKVFKERQARGETQGSAKLTENDVKIILASSESGAILARQFNVTRVTISSIRLRKSWRHVPL